MNELATVDAIAAAVLTLAALRGLWIGAVREAFSLAGLAFAAWVVRAWRLPAAVWLAAHGPFEMTDLAARVLAAAGLGAGTLVAVAVVSRLAYRGMREAGLGLADRGLGALLGALEGAIVAAALVFGLRLCSAATTPPWPAPAASRRSSGSKRRRESSRQAKSAGSVHPATALANEGHQPLGRFALGHVAHHALVADVQVHLPDARADVAEISVRHLAGRSRCSPSRRS